MNRPYGPRAAAFVAAPLLALAAVLPAGLDGLVEPLAAGGAPLAWAAAVATLGGLGPTGAAAALATALPFSAYALAAYAARPALPWLLALVAASVAALATLAAASRLARERDGPYSAARTAVALALGAAPGLATAAFGLAWPSLAVSALIASLALVAGSRRGA